MPEERFDIFHLEDDSEKIPFWERAAKEAGLSYSNTPCLNGLIGALEKKTEAGIWILDWRFPEEKGGQILELGNQAYELILARHPEAKIAFHSKSEAAIDAARKYGAPYLGELLPDEALTEIRRMLGK